MDLTLINTLDEVAARAVPASEAEVFGGWVARCSPGLATKRANSVWPRTHDYEQALDARIASVERFYFHRRLPTRHQITPASQPDRLEHLLLQRGYTLTAPTAVLRCDLASLADAPMAPRTAIRIDPTPTDGWWATWQAALEVSPARLGAVAALVARVSTPLAFATVALDGTDSAVALGVLDGRWLGIFNLATLSARRGLGAGRTALSALAGWGRERDAEAGYLQVDFDNIPALELYRAAGFEPAYRYSYLSQGARLSHRAANR